jgi:outer membrane receptor protein involved in Fe transport
MKVSILCLLCLSLCVAQTPPAAEGQTGTIAGGAFDSASGAPVPLLKITVKENPAITAQTDTSGRFTIKLAPGTYTLRFTGTNHLDSEVDTIIVQAGEVTEASTVVVPKGSVTTVDVVEKVGAEASTAEAVLAERKLSGSVSDAISNEELRNGTASDAASALEKVTGVSIVDNGFVYVRGLGERYSATQLNNAVIPTTEPERRVVPLDLFPAAMIESIKVIKTYSPDLPAEFSGGLVDMKTVEFPNKPVLRFSGNMGFNGVTTFNQFGTYPGGSRDVFGFDDGTRGLPAGIPGDRRLFQGQFTNQQLTDFGRLFPVNWEPTAVASMRPNQSYTVTGGGTFGRLGLVGAISFSNKPQLFDEQRRFYRTSGGRPVEFTRYDDFRESVESTRMGGVFNVAYRLTAANKLVFRNTLTHDSDKESRIIAGYEGGIDGDITSERLRWVERDLRSHSLEGEHAFANLKSSILRWQFTYSRSARNEPDLREVIRGKLPDGRFQFLQQSLSGQRFYNDLADNIYEPQVEWGVPFYKGGFSGIFRAGFRATLRDRTFQARRFRFIPFQTGNVNLFLPSNQLFAPANIAANRFVPVETTRGTDRYDATMDVYAGFAMVDMAIGPKWRLVGGLRVEDANINVATIDPLVPGTRPALSSLVNRDPLPAINAIYALTRRQNLRFAYSQTLSRPDFRELSPFDFTNVVGGFNTVGNPDLRRTKIQNFDARWEWFLGGNQVIAASYFVKRFDDPIETTVQAVADFRQSFINADSARNQGVELEYRQSLGRWSRKLAQFSLQSNLTYVNSRVTLPEEQALILTSKSRALVGQSPLIFNVIAEWMKPKWRSNARFYVNSVSRRITDVGTFNLPDIYQERNTVLDFVYQFAVTEDERLTMKFSAQNLTDNQYRWTQSDLLWRQFRLGRTFEVGLSFSLFR